jgi:glycine cleavage system H protein
MMEFLETTVDKFTFKVVTDRVYTEEGMWALAEGNRVRVGLSDFLQQRSGDVAFVEIQPAGTSLSSGDEIAIIETIKVNIELGSPLSGEILEINPAMELEPEAINMDPYGEGWVALLKPVDWKTERDSLLDPQAYFNLMKGQAEEEAKKL